jgi:hypothetical protein
MRPSSVKRSKPAIAVDLQDAAEAREVGRRPLALAIGAEQVERSGRIGATPRPVIAHVDPEPSDLGAAPAGIEHRHRCVVGEELAGGENVRGKPLLQRLKPPAGATNPAGEG